MKNIILAALAAILLLATVLAFTGAKPEAVAEDGPGTMYKPPVRTATITNTGRDTFTISPNLVSLWDYNLVLSCTQTSGTSNIIVVTQENNETTGTLWYETGRDTLSAASGGLLKRQFGTVRGVRHRFIATGVGAHVSVYRATLSYKQTN